MKGLFPREHTAAAAAVDLAHDIHGELGPGLPESVYEEMLARGLSERGFSVQTQVHVPMASDAGSPSFGFQADLIVDDCVLIELKSLDSLRAEHHREVLRNLGISRLGLALLFNFGEARFADGIFRFSPAREPGSIGDRSARLPAERPLFADPV